MSKVWSRIKSRSHATLTVRCKYNYATPNKQLSDRMAYPLRQRDLFLKKLPLDPFKVASTEIEINSTSCLIPGESKTFLRLAGCEIKSMRPIFKTIILIFL